MSILTPTAGPQAVYRLNPVAKLAASMVISVPLVLSIDWVSAGVALLVEAVFFLFAGLSARRFFLRTLPVWIAAALGGLTILLYGRASGQTYLQFLFVHVTDGSIELAIATLLRVLAIGLPAVALFATVDPTDLADGLAQVLRLPSRFVLGALGGLRLVGLFLDDWKALEAGQAGAGCRGPRSPAQIRRASVHAVGVVDQAGEQVGDRDGGTRFRLIHEAQLGARVAIRLARGGTDRHRRACRRGGGHRFGHDRPLELHCRGIAGAAFRSSSSTVVPARGRASWLGRSPTLGQTPT